MRLNSVCFYGFDVVNPWCCVKWRHTLSLIPFVSFRADQKNGILLDVWRRDGASFSGRDINIKYHATEETGVVWREAKDPLVLDESFTCCKYHTIKFRGRSYIDLGTNGTGKNYTCPPRISKSANILARGAIIDAVDGQGILQTSAQALNTFCGYVQRKRNDFKQVVGCTW